MDGAKKRMYDYKGLPSGKANKTITDRGDVYGHPYDNFKASGDLITVMLRSKGLLAEGAVISPLDVAQIMRFIKEARLFESPRHEDSMIDICGYMDCAKLVADREDGK